MNCWKGGAKSVYTQRDGKEREILIPPFDVYTLIHAMMCKVHCAFDRTYNCKTDSGMSGRSYLNMLNAALQSCPLWVAALPGWDSGPHKAWRAVELYPFLL